MNIVILDASETSRIRTEDLLTDLKVLADDIYSFDNAEEALEFIDDEGAHIVFSSLELTDIDGISFTDILLRKYPKMVSKLFITSSSKDSHHFQEFKEVGAKRFINKPIKEDHFKHFISREINKISGLQEK
jgi:response regulator RpfG family c-di-GMP phosphodiesterase